MMENKEILQKAINKAIDNGWYEGEAHRNLIILYQRQAGKSSLMQHYYRSIIFYHSFAKAFWGEDLIEDKEDYDWNNKLDCTYCWEFHLREMVLEKEPLKYLLRFLDES